MKNIRIGNDIGITWKILRDGKPERFEGKRISVLLENVRGEQQSVPYTINENIISIDFMGKDQNSLGTYTLLLVENEGFPNMSTLDKVDAFKLVDKSYKEGGEEDCTQLSVKSIELESNFMIQHNIFVVDNLSSTSPKDALSANQGRLLKERLIQAEKRIPSKNSELENDLNFVSKMYVDNTDRLHNEKILQLEKKNDEQDNVSSDIIKEMGTFVKKRLGYDLSQEDFTSAYKKILDNYKPYDDTLLMESVKSLKKSLDTLIGGNTTQDIDSFDEIRNFLNGFKDKQNLLSIIKNLESRIAALEK